MTDWHGFFHSVERQVRGCGWTCAFVLQGDYFRPIGTRTTQCDFVHHNDNEG